MASPVNEEKETLPSMASPVNEEVETLPSPSMAQGKETASDSKEVEELSDEAWVEEVDELSEDALAEAFLADECFCYVDPAVKQLGRGGLISVLFETPSGFAIFTYDGIKLLRPRAIEKIWSQFAYERRAKTTVWLREFKTFEDKASAISCTGVDEKLARMIQNHVLPGQKLAVGNPEYRTIIEKEMKIHCLYDGAVMELMWGLRYQMRCLVPQEKLTNEEWFPICEGIKIVLNRYDFDVKPDMMVNKCIIERVSMVYETDRFQEEQSETLHSVSRYLKDISEMNYEDWPLLKLVTALNLVCHPGKRGKYEKKMLRKAEYLRLLRDARDYEDKLCVANCSLLYKQLGHGGLISVLFETPSGFAIFTYDGIKLLRPRAIEDIWSHFAHEGMAKKSVWLDEFKAFEDKASAISCTGVDEKLAMMIQNHVLPGQKLAVGNPEYKTIIEKEMKIHCLHDGPVMELMWGLRYQMRCLVPQEKLANEEWFPVCEGIKIVLNRYDFDVKSDMMVNKYIIGRVSVVYQTNCFMEEQSETLHSVSMYLKEISEMNYEGWPLLKLVTALNLVCHPDKRGKNEKKMLRKAEYLRLLRDAREYEDKICGVNMSILYKYMWKARKDGDRALRRLFTLVGQPNFMKLNEGANNDQMIHEESNGAE